MALAAWRIEPQGPKRLPIGVVSLERNLEQWIADDTSLIESGLLTIQRQMRVEGGILDLLCVDVQGRPVVIEIKRGKLIRETIAQALDYASSVAAMPVATLREQIAHTGPLVEDHPALAALLDESSDSEREVAVIVVGVGREPGLERMIDFLGTRHGVPIRAVSFDVFDLPDGQQVLVREETEPESPPQEPIGPKFSREGVIAAAGGPDSPAGRRLLKIVEAAERNGLYARAYKWSFMLAPPQKRKRYVLVTGRWGRDRELGLTYSADAIAEFFPIDADQVRSILGPDDSQRARYAIVTDEDAAHWAEGLDRVFAVVAGASDTSENILGSSAIEAQEAR